MAQEQRRDEGDRQTGEQLLFALPSRDRRWARLLHRHRTDPPLMARAMRHNGLGLLFFVLFAAALAGQSVAGWSEYNDQQAEHMQSTIGWLSYVGS
ncbi:MAG: DUF6766 family protein, partial [Thermoleophilaceae bacterium]